MRIALIGRDINLEILRVEGYRKFCNKVFNATKFAMLKLDQDFAPRAALKVRGCVGSFPIITLVQPSGNENLVEKWILDRLNGAADEVNKQLTERNFLMATNAVYNFWLYELCDVYIVSRVPGHRSIVPHQMAGSDETYDRRIRFCCHQEVRTANSVHLFGLRSETTSPFHALRD